jgi:hypothetical protein
MYFPLKPGSYPEALATNTAATVSRYYPALQNGVGRILTIEGSGVVSHECIPSYQTVLAILKALKLR